MSDRKMPEAIHNAITELMNAARLHDRNGYPTAAKAQRDAASDLGVFWNSHSTRPGVRPTEELATVIVAASQRADFYMGVHRYGDAENLRLAIAALIKELASE